MRRELRAIWAGHATLLPTDKATPLAARLGLPGPDLFAYLRQAATFGKLWEWVLEQGRAIPIAQLPLSRALQVLPLLIKDTELSIANSQSAAEQMASPLRAYATC